MYQYVIIGAGSAGCVLANRLSEDPDVQVLLLEAGGPDENPNIHEPTGLVDLWHQDEDWAYFTAPQKHCNDRKIHLPRGKVVGGSSSLNAMIYIRGHRTDYDAWAYEGNLGWDYDSVLPYFKKSEDFDRGASHFHGAGGPMRVTSKFEPHPINAATIEAAVEQGYPRNDDFNAEEILGAGYCHMNIKDGKRHSAAIAFLRPALKRKNLTALPHATAHRLLFEGNRCVGVEYVHEGEKKQARVDREVIVCGGVMESPKLLMLSGVGDADLLSGLGVPVIQDLPGVGQNLHDHVLALIIYESKKPVPPPMPGTQFLHSQMFWKSDERRLGPDLQPLFFHVPFYLPGMEGPADAFTLMPGFIRPASRGSLRITSADPDADMHIDPCYLEEESDVAGFEDAFRLTRELGQAKALDEWRAKEIHPGPDVKSREAIRNYMRDTLISYHHQVGTCKMGLDAMAVVDPELRVHGVEGLRVADASIMPAVTSGNTNAPAIMIGEKAADFLKATAAS